MSELTLLLLRFGFLFLLWVFIFGVVYSLKSDLFGRPARRQPPTPPLVQPVADPRFSTPAAAAPANSAPPVIASPSSAYSLTQPVAVTAPSTAASRLVITSGPKEGLELSLHKEPLTIGRSGESGLVIRDDYTSTHHARLMLWTDGWVIQDLDSTNGTFLNGTRVSLPTPVPLNVTVRIGTTSFELRR